MPRWAPTLDDILGACQRYSPDVRPKRPTFAESRMLDGRSFAKMNVLWSI
jgi:hypothetical protein